MKKYLLLIILLMPFTNILLAENLYFGPSQEFTNFQEAFSNSQTGDYIIDCTNKDVKILSPGWNWVSFPVLTEQGTSGGHIFEQAYYEDNRTGLLQDTAQGLPTIDGFLRIDGKNKHIEYDDPNFVPYDFGNMLFRHEGYKVEVMSGAPTSYIAADGERLPVDYEIHGSMESGAYHWLGYWIPRTQNMIASFGDFWESVAKVKSEDWLYSPSYNQRGGDPLYPTVLSAEGLTLEYGKTYLVLFNEVVTDFYWTDSGQPTEKKEKAKTVIFEYAEKADYEAIDVFNIPSGVTEIGVFEDDICKGAVVVEDTCAQILVYSDNANRDPIPFTFEFANGRGFSTSVKDYQVFNLQTGKYETKSVFSGRQEYSIIRFANEEDPGNEILSSPQLHGNYPNPFNPTTTISFSLPSEGEIELAIYNIKGQKVKQLVSGQLSSGQHSMLWNGKDTNGKSVCTGIYFYKLKVGKKEISRKMLLLK